LDPCRQEIFLFNPLLVPSAGSCMQWYPQNIRSRIFPNTEVLWKTHLRRSECLFHRFLYSPTTFSRLQLSCPSHISQCGVQGLQKPKDDATPGSGETSGVWCWRCRHNCWTKCWPQSKYLS
jgi:hypothetical protein